MDMDAFIHASLSSKRHGGDMNDYLKVHQFLDQSKIAYADHRHRAILHNAFGIGLALQMFGQVLTVNTDQGVKQVSVRLICEEHITEDLGFVPSVQDWCSHIAIQPWMLRDRKARRCVVENTRRSLVNRLKSDEASRG